VAGGAGLLPGGLVASPYQNDMEEMAEIHRKLQMMKAKKREAALAAAGAGGANTKNSSPVAPGGPTHIMQPGGPRQTAQQHAANRHLRGGTAAANGAGRGR
jgi:hypothetical protein